MIWLSSLVYLSISAFTYPLTKAVVSAPENKISMSSFFCWLSSCISTWGNEKVHVYPRENFLRDAWPRSLLSKFPDSWSKEGPTESHSLRAAGRRQLLGALVQPLAQIRTVASQTTMALHSQVSRPPRMMISASLDDLFLCHTTSRGIVAVLEFINVLS